MDQQVREPEVVTTGLDAEPQEAAPLVPRALRPQVVQPIDERAGRAQHTDRVIVRHSDSIDALAEALAAAQCEDGYGDVEKTKTARIEKRQGGTFTYQYETLRDVLEATRPFLGRNGIAFMQFPFPGQTTVTVRTMLLHKSGQFIYNDLAATISSPAPQDVASGISYLCRYAAKSILGVAAGDEDDDGAAASRSVPQPAQRKSQQPTTAPAAQAAPAPQAAAPAAAPASAAERFAPPGQVGKIAELADRGGGMLAKLETGFVASTRDAEHMQALRAFHASGATVELETRLSSNPDKYAPVVIAVHLRRRD